MGIYIIASGVLVILWGLTALIYDKEDWHLDISTGLSILLIPMASYRDWETDRKSVV